MTQQDAQLLRNLKSHPLFLPFRQYLERKLAEADRSCRSSEGAELHRRQGRALTLQDLLDEIDSADEVLTRFDKR